MKIALIQMRMQEDPTKNLIHAEELIKKAALQYAEIICLPELFHTLYFPQEKYADAKKYAVTLESEMLEELRTLSEQVKFLYLKCFANILRLGLPASD
jgi:N-carbamoylputrescine amidase